jgi:hypothetical protein
MTKSLTEIADQLDQAQSALDTAGQAVAGAAGRGALYDASGNHIDLRQLANDLRVHAQAATDDVSEA